MRARSGTSLWLWVRIALVAFVLLWILGPSAVRDGVPLLLVFAIALGLELHFFVSALRGGPARHPNRLPQEVDRVRYGFDPEFDSEDEGEGEGEEHARGAVAGRARQTESASVLGSEAFPAAGEPRRVADDLDRPASQPIASPGWSADDARGVPVDTESFAGDAEWFAEDAVGSAGAESFVDEPARRSHWLPARRLAFGLGLIAALGALAWYADSRTGWNGLSGTTRQTAVDRFSAEASRIAGKPVSIRCDTARAYVGAVQHADGVAIVGGDLAILTPEICDDLYQLAFRHETTGSRTGRALAVLAHESWHLRGVGDEGVAECYALQTGVELGTRLGLSPGRARQLMREQLIENELRGPDTLEYRVTSACRNGGKLDLSPGRSSFP